MEHVGLYIHTPFCISKCPYCDFHSAPLQSQAQLDRYVDGVLIAMERWAQQLGCAADTLFRG